VTGVIVWPSLSSSVENLGDTAYNAVYIGIRAKRAPDKSAQAARAGDQSAMDAQTEKILSDYILASVKH